MRNLYSGFEIIIILLTAIFVCVGQAESVEEEPLVEPNFEMEIPLIKLDDQLQNETESNLKADTQDSNQITNNPFQYNIPVGSGGFLPAMQTIVPRGIKVLAIIVIEGKVPIAVLQVPGMIDVLYVQTGDIVGVETNKATASKLGKTSEVEVVYLQVENITSQQVVLSPQANPANKEIIR